MKSAFFIIAFSLWFWPLVTHAQVETAPPDTLSKPAQDSLKTASADTLVSDSARVNFHVRPWQYHAPLGADVAATDSTLRWQLWPSWIYKKNRDPGVITYRLGTIGRTNAMQIGAQEPKYQQLYWGDIRMNDPVSGTVNWNYIPQHKIKRMYEHDLGTEHRTTFYLRDYYLNKPLTQLNYTESSHDTRSLQFVASENFSQKTNAEISYWDRRDGGGYARSGITGRQIFARITHQIDQRQSVKIKFLNNHYDNNLPFGYFIPDINNFNFDLNQTSPRESSAKAGRSSTIIGLNYYRRPADSTHTTSNLQAGLFMNAQKRNVTYSADTTSYKVRQFGTSLQKWQQLGPLQLQGSASVGYFLHQQDASSTLNTGSWLLADGGARAVYSPLSSFQINGVGHIRYRSDGFSDYRLGAGIQLQLPDAIRFSADVTTGSVMPTIQQLYWQSNQFKGDETLENEMIQDLHSQLSVKPTEGSEVGLRAELKQIKNGIRVGADSTFFNSADYGVLASSLFAQSNSTHFELSGSATLQQFGHFINSSDALLAEDKSRHIWFRGSAYVKGYLFHHATYAKFGLAGMISPQPYSSARYYPSLDFWQSSKSQMIPSFNRLDAELSARVRSIIILLRYENVLDNVSQLGYFETAGYPMTERRFIFGIRVLFRD